MRWQPQSSGGTIPTAVTPRWSSRPHALGTDRSKLAAELDAASARARALETANREIARRLDVAIETIRGVLEANDR